MWEVPEKVTGSRVKFRKTYHKVKNAVIIMTEAQNEIFCHFTLNDLGFLLHSFVNGLIAVCVFASQPHRCLWRRKPPAPPALIKEITFMWFVKYKKRPTITCCSRLVKPLNAQFVPATPSYKNRSVHHHITEHFHIFFQGEAANHYIFFKFLSSHQSSNWMF